MRLVKASELKPGDRIIVLESPHKMQTVKNLERPSAGLLWVHCLNGEGWYERDIPQFLLVARPWPEGKTAGRIQLEVTALLQKCLRTKNQAEFDLALKKAMAAADEYQMGLE